MCPWQKLLSDYVGVRWPTTEQWLTAWRSSISRWPKELAAGSFTAALVTSSTAFLRTLLTHR